MGRKATARGALVFIQQHSVVRWAVGALETGVAVQEEGEAGWVDDATVDHGAWHDVTRPVGAPGVRGEHARVVALLNDDERQLHTKKLLAPSRQMH